MRSNILLHLVYLNEVSGFVVPMNEKGHGKLQLKNTAGSCARSIPFFMKYFFIQTKIPEALERRKTLAI